MIGRTAGAIGFTVALLAGTAAAQPAEKWPSMCVCKSSGPNAFATHYLAIRTDGRDFATLKTRLAEIDYAPVGKTIAVPSICPIPAACTEQDKLPVDDAELKVKILGYIADDGLVVEGRVRPEKFERGIFLVLSGRVE